MPGQPTEIQPQDQQRGFAFHWIANVFFASVAMLAGILFGERIPRDMFGVVFTSVVIIGLVMVPLTMSWEKTGIQRRRRAAEAKAEKDAAARREEDDGREPPEGEKPHRTNNPDD